MPRFDFDGVRQELASGDMNSAQRRELVLLLEGRDGATAFRAQAQRRLKSIIDSLQPGYSDDTEWGSGGETYDNSRNHAESYMTDGGGPSAWIWFIFRDRAFSDGFDDIDHAYLEWQGAGDKVLVPVPAHHQAALLIACRADAAARNSR